MKACLLRTLSASSAGFLTGGNSRLAAVSATSALPPLTLRRAGRRAFHVSAMMADEPSPFPSGAPGEPFSRVLVNHTVYKGKAALSISPGPPRFKVLNTGAYALDREGSLFLGFAHARAARAYEWSRKQTFSLSVAEIGTVLALNPEDQVDFYHDPNKGRSEEGRVQKVLRIQPFNDYSGFFFNLTVKDKIKGIDDKIAVGVTRAEFTVIRSGMNYILPYLMGWHALANPGTIDVSMTVPSAPSMDNNWQ